MLPRERIQQAIEQARKPALIAFMTAGYPDPAHFLRDIRAVAEAADAIEVGVPFSDPMADGVTIQRASRIAIENGVNLHWILDQLANRDFDLKAPVLLMSYLNPLLAFGYDALAKRSREAGVGGFIVPDLPYEESAPLKDELDREGLALVQLVTPATPPERLKALTAAGSGFVYAVTRTGITGGESGLPAELAEYLKAVKSVSPIPVCAGFGVRERSQVELIGSNADGVIVGSALVEVLERGESPAAFLTELRG